jgi:hypothetical protein
MPRRPDVALAIERLGKFAGSDDWHEQREAHLETMLGPLLEHYDLELEACFDEVAALGHSETLFAFLHESFLAAEFGSASANAIDAFLARRGWQQTPRAREYLKGIRTTPASLYEVHDVAPGEWVELSDLYRGGPPRRIAEQSGSRDLHRWDRLIARIVIAGEEEMLSGAIVPLVRESAEVLEGILVRVRDKGQRSAKALARKHGIDLALDEGDTLANPDSLFLQVWLKGLLDAKRRPPPTLQNTDGEPLLLTTTRLPVAAQASAEIARRLDTLADWHREPDDEPPGWIWQPGSGTPATVHAVARLQDDSLVLETNSRARMERALAALQNILGTLIGTGLTSHEDPLQRLRLGKPHDAGEAPQDALPTGPEIEAMLRQFKDAHYRRVLDEPVPMLGDRTPRACARTKSGRARLVRWLKELENGEQHGAVASGQPAYDVTWIWQELGLRPTGGR